MDDPLLTIGELAGRSGVAPSALRFYEENGLISAERTRAGHRRFPRSTLRRVAFIVFAQRLGLTLGEIGSELGRLPTERVPTGRDWEALSAQWISLIDRRSAGLERLRHSLSQCIGCGCLSLEHCALANPHDRVAAFGSGPAKWRDTGKPGRTGSSEVVFEGVKFDVERRYVPNRDGGNAVREVVVHPGAVVVLPLLEDGRIVMIRNRRFAVDETLWELCAGTLEPEEEPALTAARELIEETGYEARRLEPLTTFYTSPGISDERMHAFVATGLTQVGQRLEATEQIEVELLSREDVMALAASGEIRDGKTLATLLFWDAFQER